MSKQQLELSEKTKLALTALSLGRTTAPAATLGPDPIIIAPANKGPLPPIATLR